MAAIETIDGVPVGPNSTMAHYPHLGNFGKYSQVSGTCEGAGPGTTYVILYVGRQYNALTGGSQLSCDSQGRFSGPVSALSSGSTWLLGDQTATLYATYCDGFSACNNAPHSSAPVVLRYLDIFASTPGFSGTSSNRYLEFTVGSGQEIGTQSGPTGMFLAAQYAGTIFMIYQGAAIDCNTNTQRIMYGSGIGSSCNQLVISPFSDQTFYPVGQAPAGTPAGGTFTIYFGSLEGVHGATLLVGVAKSLTQLLGQNQYGSLAQLD